jgi:hypothetical protein
MVILEPSERVAPDSGLMIRTLGGWPAPTPAEDCVAEWLPDPSPHAGRRRAAPTPAIHRII